MTSEWRPIDGDEIIASPAAPEPGTADDVHAAETSGASADSVSEAADGHPADEYSRVTRPKGRVIDSRSLVVAALLLVVIAQLVVGFLALSSINQLRDQTTAANGLQRCLIAAELKPATATNPNVVQSGVQACLSR